MTSALYLNADGSTAQDVTDLGTSFASATINSGAITYSASLMTVDTEGGAAFDDLTTIANGGTGKLLLLRSANAARAITLKTTGNIHSAAGDLTLTDPDRLIMLVYNGSKWVVIGMGSAGLGGAITPIDGGSLPGGETVPCVSAGRARAYLKYVIDAMKAQLSSGYTSVGTALRNALALAVDPTPLTVNLWALVNTFTGAFADASAVDAAFTTAAYDNLQCEIWSADADENGLYSAAEIAALITALEAWGSDAGDVLAGIVALLGSAGMNAALLTSAALTSPINCDSCDGWCYTFDFTSSDGGFSLYGTGQGEYVSGNGWEVRGILLGGINRSIAQITRSFSSTTLTQITMVYDYVAGTQQSGVEARVIFVNGTARKTEAQPRTTVYGTSITWTGTIVGATSIILTVQSAVGAQNGGGRIIAVTLHGTGSNPFGSENC